MMRPGLIFVVLIVLVLLASNPAEALLAPPPPPPPRPPPLLWYGVATSSYQIEGAFDEGNRGPSIWDTFSHSPGKTARGETGDVAADFYHRYAEDIRLAGELGVQKFRLSISWPRIFPNRTLSDDGAALEQPNEEGFAFYERVLDALEREGIEPLVTLYHWVRGGGWRRVSFLPAFFFIQGEERRKARARVRERKKTNLLSLSLSLSLFDSCEITLSFPKKTHNTNTGPSSSLAGHLRRLDLPQDRRGLQGVRPRRLREAWRVVVE